ncbi:MAG: hypothetical protein LBS31_06865, partial [Candidatus Adiutrix sp.]|nr:hypothetical protein [Candidatus Adiutrix sp.]
MAGGKTLEQALADEGLTWAGQPQTIQAVLQRLKDRGVVPAATIAALNPNSNPNPEPQPGAAPVEQTPAEAADDGTAGADANNQTNQPVETPAGEADQSAGSGNAAQSAEAGATTPGPGAVGSGLQDPGQAGGNAENNRELDGRPGSSTPNTPPATGGGEPGFQDDTRADGAGSETDLDGTEEEALDETEEEAADETEDETEEEEEEETALDPEMEAFIKVMAENPDNSLEEFQEDLAGLDPETAENWLNHFQAYRALAGNPGAAELRERMKGLPLGALTIITNQLNQRRADVLARMDALDDEFESSLEGNDESGDALRDGRGVDGRTGNTNIGEDGDGDVGADESGVGDAADGRSGGESRPAAGANARVEAVLERALLDAGRSPEQARLSSVILGAFFREALRPLGVDPAQWVRNKLAVVDVSGGRSVAGEVRRLDQSGENPRVTSDEVRRISELRARTWKHIGSNGSKHTLFNAGLLVRQGASGPWRALIQQKLNLALRLSDPVLTDFLQTMLNTPSPYSNITDAREFLRLQYAEGGFNATEAEEIIEAVFPLLERAAEMFNVEAVDIARELPVKVVSPSMLGAGVMAATYKIYWRNEVASILDVSSDLRKIAGVGSRSPMDVIAHEYVHALLTQFIDAPQVQALAQAVQTAAAPYWVTPNPYPMSASKTDRAHWWGRHMPTKFDFVSDDFKYFYAPTELVAFGFEGYLSGQAPMSQTFDQADANFASAIKAMGTRGVTPEAIYGKIGLPVGSKVWRGDTPALTTFFQDLGALYDQRRSDNSKSVPRATGTVQAGTGNARNRNVQSTPGSGSAAENEREIRESASGEPGRTFGGSDPDVETNERRRTYFQSPLAAPLAAPLTLSAWPVLAKHNGKTMPARQLREIITNAQIKNQDRELLLDFLRLYPDSQKINFDDFREAVNMTLEPLGRVSESRYADVGLDKVSLPPRGRDDADYSLILQDPSIEHGSTKHWSELAKNAFGHLRFWLRGEVAYVAEIQSDYFQWDARVDAEAGRWAANDPNAQRAARDWLMYNWKPPAELQQRLDAAEASFGRLSRKQIAEQNRLLDAKKAVEDEGRAHRRALYGQPEEVARGRLAELDVIEEAFKQGRDLTPEQLGFFAGLFPADAYQQAVRDEYSTYSRAKGKQKVSIGRSLLRDIKRARTYALNRAERQTHDKALAENEEYRDIVRRRTEAKDAYDQYVKKSSVLKEDAAAEMEIIKDEISAAQKKAYGERLVLEAKRLASAPGDYATWTPSAEWARRDQALQAKMDEIEARYDRLDAPVRKRLDEIKRRQQRRSAEVREGLSHKQRLSLSGTSDALARDAEFRAIMEEEVLALQELNALDDEKKKELNPLYNERHKMAMERVDAWNAELDRRLAASPPPDAWNAAEKRFLAFANNELYQDRLIREAVDEAVRQGRETVAFPTPDTLSKIEGYGLENLPPEEEEAIRRMGGRRVAQQRMKKRTAPILKKYADLPKKLAKFYGAQNVTQDGDWVYLNLTGEIKNQPITYYQSPLAAPLTLSAFDDPAFKAWPKNKLVSVAELRAFATPKTDKKTGRELPSRLKAADRALILEFLEPYDANEKFRAGDFQAAVEAGLAPLERVTSADYANYGLEDVYPPLPGVLPDDGEYSLILQDPAVKHNYAGHWGKQGANAFGHIRVWLRGKTAYIAETQSDYFQQKARFDKAVGRFGVSSEAALRKAETWADKNWTTSAELQQRLRDAESEWLPLAKKEREAEAQRGIQSYKTAAETRKYIKERYGRPGDAHYDSKMARALLGVVKAYSYDYLTPTQRDALARDENVQLLLRRRDKEKEDSWQEYGRARAAAAEARDKVSAIEESIRTERAKAVKERQIIEAQMMGRKRRTSVKNPADGWNAAEERFLAFADNELYQDRLIREAVAEAMRQGRDAAAFPTVETLRQIEGYDQAGAGFVIDGGKLAPILKKYADLPKKLAKFYGAQNVTSDGDWVYLNLTDEIKNRPMPYYQNTPQGVARGFMSLLDNNRLALAFTEASDASSPIHEGMHVILETVRQVLATPLDQIVDMAAYNQLRQEMITLREWMGETNPEDVTAEPSRRGHERAAVGLETYMMEGKAPTPELQPLFDKFKSWLMGVYRTVRELLDRTPGSKPLNPEIRRIFDRWLTEGGREVRAGPAPAPAAAAADALGRPAGSAAATARASSGGAATPMGATASAVGTSSGGAATPPAKRPVGRPRKVVKLADSPEMPLDMQKRLIAAANKMARNYLRNRPRDVQVSVEDAASEAVTAALAKWPNYNPAKGADFLTFVHQEMLGAIEKFANPTNLARSYNNDEKYIRNNLDKAAREAGVVDSRDPVELAAALNAYRASDPNVTKQGVVYTPPQIQAELEFRRLNKIASLDKPAPGAEDGEEGDPLVETLANPGARADLSLAAEETADRDRGIVTDSAATYFITHDPELRALMLEEADFSEVERRLFDRTLVGDDDARNPKVLAKLPGVGKDNLLPLLQSIQEKTAEAVDRLRETRPELFENMRAVLQLEQGPAPDIEDAL